MSSTWCRNYACDSRKYVGGVRRAFEDLREDATCEAGNRRFGQKPAGASNLSRSAIAVSGSTTLAG